MLDRNLGASNSDFYSPGSANIANDKSSIGGYFKISNDKNSNAYIDKYVIGNFRVPKGNELEAIANKTSVKLLRTSTGEPYNCLRIPTSLRRRITSISQSADITRATASRMNITQIYGASLCCRAIRASVQIVMNMASGIFIWISIIR